MSHILVRAGTSSPVPLPLHTHFAGSDPGRYTGSIVVDGFDHDTCYCRDEDGLPLWRDPSCFDLEIITEAEFAERQALTQQWQSIMDEDEL